MAPMILMRFAINTTVGVGGLIDVASAGGMPKHQAGFGQTLGVWGVPAGPYVVLPILGPSTLGYLGDTDRFQRETSCIPEVQ